MVGSSLGLTHGRYNDISNPKTSNLPLPLFLYPLWNLIEKYKAYSNFQKYATISLETPLDLSCQTQLVLEEDESVEKILESKIGAGNGLSHT